MSFNSPSSRAFVVSQELDRFKAMPDFSLYVIMVFFRCENEASAVRQVAGLMLKDYIKLNSQMLVANAELLGIIRSQVVSGLQLILDGPVRRTLGSIVTQLVSSLGDLYASEMC